MHQVARLLFYFCAACLSGCAANGHLPKGLPPTGYTEVVSIPLGPFRYFYTRSIVPGRHATSSPRTVQCTGTEREITLRLTDEPSIDVQKLCTRVDAAARFAESCIPASSNKYRILLAPEGIATTVRARSFGWYSTGRTLALAVPVHVDRDKTFANLVDLVAHETLHALGHSTGHPRALDERSAYYAGLCAQLEINGIVMEESLPGAPLASDDHAVVDSSQSAYRVRLETYPFLENGIIQIGSRSGELMLLRCQQIQREIANLR